jgi:hypothetical protein
MIGKKYNRLIVLSFSHCDKRNRKHYLCKCDCGKEKTVQISLLKSGRRRPIRRLVSGLLFVSWGIQN